MGGYDFINGEQRFCLWLVDALPEEIRSLPGVLKRVDQVREFRVASKAASTRDYAKFPALFRQIAQPEFDYLAVPEVSSENRSYIPIAFVSKEVICSNTVQFIPDATVFHFGVLTSVMHMAWMRQVCGRLKSDYRYSNSLVYNNFPWPKDVSTQNHKAVEAAGQRVLDARAEFPGSTLADLYDPRSMPPVLMKAHQNLDRVVDLCYRPQPFVTETARVEFLFNLYAQYTESLLNQGKNKRNPRVRA
jgi:hypothetical protein